MVRRCYVKDCTSDSRNPCDIGVTYHKVPLIPEIRTKWIELCKFSVEEQSYKCLSVCSKHFLRRDFCTFKGSKYYLKQGVYPSIFPWTKEEFKKKLDSQSTVLDDNITPATELDNDSPSELQNLNEDKLKPLDIDEKLSEKKITENAIVNEFTVGLKLEINDFNNEWKLAIVKEIDTSENEVLIEFDKGGTKHEEWIPMSSNRIRLATNKLFEIDERVMATWRNNMKFCATIKQILNNDKYLVLFDDGIETELDQNKIFKIKTTKNVDATAISEQNLTLPGNSTPATLTHSSPLFAPVEGTKQDRRDRSRRHVVSELFAKQRRKKNIDEQNSSPDKTIIIKPTIKLNEQSLPKENKTLNESLPLATNTSLEEKPPYWICHWNNGVPEGKPSILDSRKSIIVDDPAIPKGWQKHFVCRTQGMSAGKYDVVIVSPDGKRFRTSKDLQGYLERTKSPYTMDSFDFSLRLKEARMLGFLSYDKSHKPLKISQRQSENVTEISEVASTENAVNDKESTSKSTKKPKTPIKVNEEEKAKEDVLPMKNQLKIILDNGSYKCPIEKCEKTFRKENLAQMHIKHYHPEYVKFIGRTPKVADLAYARITDEVPSGQLQISKARVPIKIKRYSDGNPVVKNLETKPLRLSSQLNTATNSRQLSMNQSQPVTLLSSSPQIKPIGILPQSKPIKLLSEQQKSEAQKISTNLPTIQSTTKQIVASPSTIETAFDFPNESSKEIKTNLGKEKIDENDKNPEIVKILTSDVKSPKSSDILKLETSFSNKICETKELIEKPPISFQRDDNIIRSSDAEGQIRIVKKSHHKPIKTVLKTSNLIGIKTLLPVARQNDKELADAYYYNSLHEKDMPHSKMPPIKLAKPQDKIHKLKKRFRINDSMNYKRRKSNKKKSSNGHEMSSYYYGPNSMDHSFSKRRRVHENQIGGGDGQNLNQQSLLPLSQQQLQQFQQTPSTTPAQKPKHYVTETGEIIKIVSMKKEEIINCTCGITEEDGLMIQCELCLCWQHASCNNIEREEQVPDKYICYICQNPIRERPSKKYVHDQDWLKHGVLVTGSYHSIEPKILKERFEHMRRINELLGNLHELLPVLHSLKIKLKIAENKDHPKFYLWSKSWGKCQMSHNLRDILENKFDSSLQKSTKDVKKEIKRESQPKTITKNQTSNTCQSNRPSFMDNKIKQENNNSSFLTGTTTVEPKKGDNNCNNSDIIDFEDSLTACKIIKSSSNSSGVVSTSEKIKIENDKNSQVVDANDSSNPIEEKSTEIKKDIEQPIMNEQNEPMEIDVNEKDQIEKENTEKLDDSSLKSSANELTERMEIDGDENNCENSLKASKSSEMSPTNNDKTIIVNVKNNQETEISGENVNPSTEWLTSNTVNNNLMIANNSAENNFGLNQTVAASNSSDALLTSPVNLGLGQNEIDKIQKTIDNSTNDILNQPLIPEPEAKIEPATCRMNLIEHIRYYIQLVTERMDAIEEQIEILEQQATKCDARAINTFTTPDARCEPRMKETLTMLVRDLGKVRKMAALY